MRGVKYQWMARLIMHVCVYLCVCKIERSFFTFFELEAMGIKIADREGGGRKACVYVCRDNKKKLGHMKINQ